MRADASGADSSTPDNPTIGCAPTTRMPAARLLSASTMTAANDTPSAATSLPVKISVRVRERVNTVFHVLYRSSAENTSPPAMLLTTGRPHKAAKPRMTSETARPESLTARPNSVSVGRLVWIMHDERRTRMERPAQTANRSRTLSCANSFEHSTPATAATPRRCHDDVARSGRRRTGQFEEQGFEGAGAAFQVADRDAAAAEGDDIPVERLLVGVDQQRVVRSRRDTHAAGARRHLQRARVVARAQDMGVVRCDGPQLVDRAGENHPSAIDDRDRAADLLHGVEIVAAEHDGRAVAGELPHHRADVACAGRIDRAGGLVEQEQPRAAQQGRGEPEALAHAG